VANTIPNDVDYRKDEKTEGVLDARPFWIWVYIALNGLSTTLVRDLGFINFLFIFHINIHATNIASVQRKFSLDGTPRCNHIRHNRT
jgi:hypothetical protein